MQDRLYQGAYSCGKIAAQNIYKLTAKHINVGGKLMPGATKYEILTYLYLTQIADESGFITAFETSSLASVIGCSRRTVFYLLSSLSQKQLIATYYYNGKRHTGIKDIRLINNDYRNVSINATNQYLNTYLPIFNFAVSGNVNKLLKLSTYALRMLLFIAHKYDPHYGQRFSVDTVRVALGIRSRSLVNKYVDELRKLNLLGDDAICMIADRTNGYRYGIVSVQPGLLHIVRDDVRPGQLTYYKRKWQLFWLHNTNALIPLHSVEKLVGIILKTVNKVFNTYRRPSIFSEIDDFCSTYLCQTNYRFDTSNLDLLQFKIEELFLKTS